jgi:transposase
MDFATTSGNGSRTCFPASWATPVQPPVTIVALSVLCRYRAGIPWRDLPERFGDSKNTHRRLSRWAKAGVWERVFQHLAVDGNNKYAMIDSTIVRAHQHSAGALKKDEDQAPLAAAAAV